MALSISLVHETRETAARAAADCDVQRGDVNSVALRPTPAGEAALAAAQAVAKNAAASNTLRADKADWAHFSQWCVTHGFVPVPAAPATVGAYLASLADSHAPTTIRRRLSALGKMHRFNDLPWNPAHRDIQGPLQGVLRTRGPPVHKKDRSKTWGCTFRLRGNRLECGMKWRVMLELVEVDGTVSVRDLGGGAAVAEYAPRTIGLTLAEGKRILAETQRHLVQAQTEEHCRRRQI